MHKLRVLILVTILVFLVYVGLWACVVHAQLSFATVSAYVGADPTSEQAPAEVEHGRAGGDQRHSVVTPPVSGPALNGLYAPRSVPADYATVPDDLLPVTITVNLAGRSDGYLFLAPYKRKRQMPYSPYLLILDGDGELVYHNKVSAAAEDFKVQQNGRLSYTVGGSYTHQVMDGTYQVIDSVRAARGFLADFHDFQILPDGHMLLIIYEPRQVDMSQVVEGGDPGATVTGCRIQELDEGHDVVFEWSSFDHFAITDSTKNLLESEIDYAHCNSIERDWDGHLLLSSRAMNEVTKIHSETGEIIWRLGGKRNEFEFVNATEAEEVEFIKQHDARRVANGNLTLFDNHSGAPSSSRAVEYHLDEAAKVATLVWEYRNDPEINAQILGNAQRLANGNILIGWGSGRPAAAEVTPDGRKVFELELHPRMQNYRAFRFPWVGRPDSEPTLVAHTDVPTITLSYSWNGATDVAAYRVYGDRSDTPTHLVDVRPKTGFETTTVITDMLDGPYNFRVVAVDKCGNAMMPGEVPASPVMCSLRLPLILR